MLFHSLFSGFNWNLAILVFVEGGKPEDPGENPQRKDENQQQTQPTYVTYEVASTLSLVVSRGHLAIR